MNNILFGNNYANLIPLRNISNLNIPYKNKILLYIPVGNK